MRVYLEQSFQFWDEGHYEKALDIWEECLRKQVFVEEILSIIEEAFLTPNEEEVAGIYVNSMNEFYGREISKEEALVNCRKFNTKYLCYGEGKYYVLDRQQKRLLGKLDYSVKFDVNYIENTVFEDVLIVNPESPVDILKTFFATGKTRIFCMGEQKEELYSIYTIPEVNEILEMPLVFLKDVDAMRQYFLNNKASYLPKRFWGNGSKELMEKIQQEFWNLHDKRCKKEYRDDTNVLLTICIPTFNRGHRALELVRELQNTYYDAEIEILVSDNNSDLYMEKYAEIAAMNDARISYYHSEENVGFLGNYKRVFELAKGKYALLIADEDHVNLQELPAYLSVLRNCENLGLLRGSGQGGKNMEVLPRAFYPAGDASFQAAYGRGNYISGTIYLNTEETKEVLAQIYEDFKEDILLLHYPHSVYSPILCKDRNLVVLNNILITEGEAEDTPDTEKVSDELLRYMTVESRLAQLKGWIKILEKAEGISEERKLCCYAEMCRQTFKLLCYKKASFEKPWKEICNLVLKTCAEEYKKNRFLTKEYTEYGYEGFSNVLMDFYEENL